MQNKIQHLDLGMLSFKKAWEIQEKLFKRLIEQKLLNRNAGKPDRSDEAGYLIFCEHSPVITLGKSGHESNLLANREYLQKEKGIDFYKINRGGDITFHGPGQLVGYPILDLNYFFTDIHRYMRSLEEMIILTLAEYGLKGERLQGATGVWLDAADPAKARKICAMGVRTSRWVTMHGFAFNINTDLSYFDLIVPCGIKGKAVTSLQKELGYPVDMDTIKSKVLNHFETVFDTQLLANIKA